jgi:hypothetical protein
MVSSDKDVGVAENDDENLFFDVSDDALERAAVIIGGQATPVTLVYVRLSWAIAPAPYENVALRRR